MEAGLEKISHEYGGPYLGAKKQQRRKRQKNPVTNLLCDYAQNSTMHGVRYLTERRLSIMEKIFWFTIVTVSVMICSYTIYRVYQKFITSPVIVTGNGLLASVASVPFPSVTICPQIKVLNNLYNYTEAKNKFINNSLEGDDLVRYVNIGTMCDVAHGSYPDQLTNVSYVSDITEVAPDDIFLKCSWYDTSDINCKDLFSKVYTEDGVCYTANSLAATEYFKHNIQTEYQYLDSNSTSAGWSLDFGYDDHVNDTYPRRGRVVGYKPDMSIELVQDPDKQDKKCNVLFSGYTICLQNPADFPQSSLCHYSAHHDQVTTLAISFHKTEMPTNLYSYPPYVRECYSHFERPLRYFNIYTEKNCKAECLSNYTFKMCGCVGYYMPHNDSTQICAPSQRDCINKAKDYMAQNEISTDIKIEGTGCGCIPTCNYIEYYADMFKKEYNLRDAFKQFYNFTSKDVFSRIDLYFKKPYFVTIQRRELYSVTDMLANVGGLLGVFLGFSFLSLIEILYFLTIRICYTRKRDVDEEQLEKMTKLKDVKTN